MLWKRAYLAVSVILLSIFISSCQFFQNDVADFLETYTETAAIDNHDISVQTYFDAATNLCLSSEENAEIRFYMRNPKRFRLNPSVSFDGLNAQIDRTRVTIEQLDDITIRLSLPQEFLIASDEGQNISSVIGLYEPMSGREFNKYSVNLNCNTIPPVILNPTILNNNGQTFVIAFDMPNEEEVAIRHKDITSVVIDGTSYPVTVSTEVESDGVNHAIYTFADSRFSRTRDPSWIAINYKDFTHTRNSVYFDTGEQFVAVDKEYTLTLQDTAGLSSTAKASTVISKLLKPVIKNQKGSEISERGMTGIPFDEDTQIGSITIYPPEQDHLGNPVSGATVHYKIYEATGSGIIYASGTTTEAKTIELPQNTYRVEAYATLTNYETSATTTVKFRFINNALYVNPSSINGDGSEAAPWASVAEAFADINDPDRRREVKFTIYIEGDLQEEVVIDDTLNVDEVEFERKAGAATAKIKSFDINTSKIVTIGNVTVTNTDSGGTGIKLNDGAILTLKGSDVSGSSGPGIYFAATTAVCNIEDARVTGNNIGVDLKSEFAAATGEGGTLNVKGNTVIRDNVTANVMLSANGAGSTVHVNGRLSSSARIGVKPIVWPSGDDKIVITSGYSIYNSTAPGYVFFSDEPYGVMLQSGEAALSQSQGIVSNQYEYTVEFVPADGSANFDTAITPNQAKTISVAPVIKRNGVDITSIVPAADLQWELYVTCHSDTIETSTTNSITLAAASVTNDVYYVHVNLIYKGRLFDTQIRLEPVTEIVFESSSIADLKAMIEGAADGTTILMKNGVTNADQTITTVIETNGKIITLKRAPGYTGALITLAKDIWINKDHGGSLILDGGSEEGIVATAPLLIDNYGCDSLYHITFQNNNNVNGNGGGAMVGNHTRTTQFLACVFNNCHAKNGGAAYINSSVTISLNTTIHNCSATEYGGALYLTAYAHTTTVWIVFSTPQNWNTITVNDIDLVINNTCSVGISGGGDKVYFHKGSYGTQINNYGPAADWAKNNN
ncbi:MAG: hypothetical protein K6A15_02210 [Treponema sp.]|nr:hypothetical protein [Treponema sp.]